MTVGSGGAAAVVWACLAAVIPAAHAHGPAAPSSNAPSPRALCRTAGTDDRLRGIPDALVPETVRLFHLEAMPAEQVRRSSYFRCFERHVLVCTVGANLPCGKANTRRHLPAADAWCAGHPGSGFIPMYVTGHDTIYAWRCDGPQAAIAKTVFQVDPRGFIRQVWKRAGAPSHEGGH
jgi:hypothetical protein